MGASPGFHERFAFNQKPGLAPDGSGCKKTEERNSCEYLSSAASSLPGPTHTTKSQKENFQMVCWIIPLRYRPKLRGLGLRR
jgi:hypothetical protein